MPEIEDGNGNAQFAIADFAMTDLEERLRSPSGAEAAEQLLGTFNVRAKSISQALADGLSPGDFDKAKAILNALASAQMIVIDLRKF